jgi:hypothetical protein
MVIHYYGWWYHSWDYAKAKNLGSSDGVLFKDLYDYIWSNYYPSLLPTLQRYSSGSYEAMKRDIQSNITSGYPVLVNLIKVLSSIPYNDVKHLVAVIGFNETGAFVNEPSGALFKAGKSFLDWSPDHARYPVSLDHAYIEWNDLLQFVVTTNIQPRDYGLLAVAGVAPAQPASGTIWVHQKTDVEFVNSNNSPITQLELSKGLHWVDTQGNTNEIVPGTATNFLLKLFCSNSRQQSQTFSIRLYLMSGGNVVRNYGLTQLNPLDGFRYRSTSGLDPDYMVSINIGGIGQILQKSRKYYWEIDLVNADGSNVDTIYTPAFYWIQGTTAMLAEQQQHLFLHIYDEQGNHVGLNYSTNQIELGIPECDYYDDGNGTIIMVVPQIMNLRIVVDARYAEHPVESYNLTVTLSTDVGFYSTTETLNITAGQRQTFTTVASQNGLTLYVWQYIFKDERRGTELRINTDDKYFQFFAPGKDFGVKYDPKMFVRYGVIVICYGDSEMCLTATAVNGVHFCTAIAYDKQTRKTYWLFDMPNWPRYWYYKQVM